MNPMTSPTRRDFARAGVAAAAAAGAAVLTPDRAEAQAPGTTGRLPDLYPGLNAAEFRAIQTHENAHLAAVRQLLGAQARPKPNFRNLAVTDIQQFVNMARIFGNTGVGANLGAAPAVFNRQILAVAASIVQMEGRHSGYFNVLTNRLTTQNVFDVVQDFDRPLTQQEVINIYAPFIVDFAGAAAPAFSPTPSRRNDVDILNFAIIAEYIEVEFYALNVPRFFPQS